MVTLRSATNADALAIADVHVRSWQVGYKGLLPQEFLDSLRPEDRASQYRLESSDPSEPLTIVAEENGICGFVTFGPSRDTDDKGVGELYALYVDPPRWSEGIGQLLVDAARTQLHKQGQTEALVWMLATNVRAQNFYLRDGWQLDGGERGEDVWGISVHVIRMRRSLP